MSLTIDDPALTPIRRARLLATVEEEPLSQGEIVDRLDYARTTAYRALGELSDHGLVRETDDGYATTPRGAALAAAAQRYLDAVEAIDGLRPVLESVDHPALYERWDLLTSATVCEADRENPHRVLDRIVALLDGAGEISVAMTGVTTLDALGDVSAALKAADAATVLFTPSSLVAHRSVSRTFVADLEGSDGVTLEVGDVPFTHVVADDRAAVVGHDETTGLPLSVAETDDPLARAWLALSFASCREDTRAVEQADPR